MLTEQKRGHSIKTVREQNKISLLETDQSMTLNK